MSAGKTGALLGCAVVHRGRAGRGARRHRRGRCVDFGTHLGLAFQAVDDLLGIWGDPDRTGKPAGSDLRQHKKTLPVVAALASGADEADASCAGLLRDGRRSTRPQVERAAALVEACGARSWTANRAKAHLDAALGALEPGAHEPASPTGELSRPRRTSSSSGSRDRSLAGRPTPAVGAALRPGAASTCSALQDPDGWWKGELETNVTMDAEDLLLRQFLGILDAGRWRPRRPAGSAPSSAPTAPGPRSTAGPADLSTTVEAYVALRLAGDARRRRPHAAGAPTFVREPRGHRGQPGLHPDLAGAVRPVVLGRPARRCRPSSCSCRRGAPLNIYDFGCWARQTVVALTVVVGPPPGPARCRSASTSCAPGAGRRRPAAVRLRTVAAAPSASSTGCCTRYERLPAWFPPAAAAPPRPAPGRALDRAPPGGRRLLGRHPAAVGVLDHGPAPAGLPARPSRSLPARAWRASSASPSTTTGAAASRRASRRSGTPPWRSIALADAGVDPDDPALVRGGRLAARRGGHGAPATGRSAGPGSRPAAGRSSSPTTTTPTSTTPPRSCWPSIGSAVDDPARRATPPSSGRWPGPSACSAATAAGAPSTSTTPAGCVAALPFCDFGEVIDPPSADVTAHVVEMLAAEPAGRARPSDRGRGLARAAQEPDGSWFGRWGVNYVYGTGAAVPGAGRRRRARRRPSDPPGGAPGSSEHQNADGGWGEDLRSYRDDRLAGPGQLDGVADGVGAARPARRRRALERRRRARAVGLARRRPSAPTAPGTSPGSPAPASPATSTSTTTSTGWCSRSWPSAGSSRGASR